MSRTKVPAGQIARKGYAIPMYASSDNSSIGGASSGAATVTVPAQSVIGQIIWSYAGSAGIAGGLNVSDSTGTLFDVNIVSGGKADMNFNPPISSQITTSVMTVVLSGAGTTSATGHLNLNAWQEL